MFVWVWDVLGGNSKPDVYLILGVVVKFWFGCGVGRGSYVDCVAVVL